MHDLEVSVINKKDFKRNIGMEQYDLWTASHPVASIVHCHCEQSGSV